MSASQTNTTGENMSDLKDHMMTGEKKEVEGMTGRITKTLDFCDGLLTLCVSANLMFHIQFCGADSVVFFLFVF